MSLNQVNSSGELEKVAGLVNSEKINEMYEAFPSDASASNQLVTESDVDYFYQTSDVEGEYDANDFAVAGKITRYCVKSPAHGYQVDGTAWWGFYETVCFRGGGYGYQTFRTMLGMPAMAIRQLYNGSWGSWEKLVTESDLVIKKIDISAVGGATSFLTTIPLSMAQRNKTFYLEVLSVGDNNAIKEMKYLVFVSSINTNVTTREISKDSTFTDVSITFNESKGYELSFSSTSTLYSTILYIQQ